MGARQLALPTAEVWQPARDTDPTCRDIFDGHYSRRRYADGRTPPKFVRNEGPLRSSDLIRGAVRLAWQRWPGATLYTYVDAARIRSTNPGYCFLAAGWRRLPERTKRRGLRVLVLDSAA